MRRDPQRVGEVHTDPQVIHKRVAGRARTAVDRHHQGARSRRPRSLSSGTPAEIGRHAPKLDEHTDEVLGEARLRRRRDRLAPCHRGVAGARR